MKVTANGLVKLMYNITAIGEILFDMYPTSKNLGGAPLNFLYHVHKIIGSGNMVSRIGCDVLGEKVFDFLGRNRISTEHIQQDHFHPTGATTVVLNDKNEPSFIIDTETAYDFIERTSELERLIKKETDCLYFGSLAQRSEVTRNTIQSLFDKGVKYFCDLNIRQNFFNKEIIEQSLKTTDVLKVSIDELRLLNDLLVNDLFDMTKTSAELMEKYNIEILAVTLGSDGSALFRNGEFDYYKSKPFEAIDTLGAGDAFASVLCIGYLRRWSLRKINKLANHFAAEICKIPGAMPENDDIYDFIKEKITDD